MLGLVTPKGTLGRTELLNCFFLCSYLNHASAIEVELHTGSSALAAVTPLGLGCVCLDFL